MKSPIEQPNDKYKRQLDAFKLSVSVITKHPAYATGSTLYAELARALPDHPQLKLDPEWIAHYQIVAGLMLLAIEFSAHHATGTHALFFVNSINPAIKNKIPSQFKNALPVVDLALFMAATALSQPFNSTSAAQTLSFYIFMQLTQYFSGKAIDCFFRDCKNKSALNVAKFFTQTATTLLTARLLFPYLYATVAHYLFATDPTALLRQKFNLTEDASADDIEKEYRKWVRLNHPDKTHTTATEEFYEIKNARDALKGMQP